MYDVDVRYALHDIVMDLARSCYHDCDDALRSRGFKSRVISKKSSVVDQKQDTFVVFNYRFHLRTEPSPIQGFFL